MGRIVRSLFAAACVAASLVAREGASAGDKKAADEIRALIAAGKGAEALAKARKALVVSGDDFDLLDLAADAAASAASPDEALWFQHAARCAATRAGMTDRAATLAAKAEALEPKDLGDRAPIDAATTSALETAKVCARKRCFVNAVQILSRLESTPVELKAAAELERIYADKQAVTALLDSDVSVPRTVTNRKQRAKLAKDDPKHATWDTAIRIETQNYAVVTDAGYDVAQDVATAMEPMNRFYRKVFRYRDKPSERSSATPRCTVKVYRSRAEFDSIAQPPKDALAFYSPSDNSVSAYDPRSEGLPFASIWSTLFHEASHQFTEMISGDQPVPAWLNEGTASYFEGSALRVDGRVETNLVPSYRLDGCIWALDGRAPTVKEVLSYSEPGSYAAEYYPVGWALVYFLRNYVDEKLDHVYEKAYGALLDSYRVGGGAAAKGKKGPTGPLPSFDRFVKYFVTDMKVAGVSNFEQFEDRFQHWIRDLERFHGDSPHAARDFADRAGRHLALGHKEEAASDFRFALGKNPDLHVALTGLGDLLAAAGRRDEAISCFRRAAEAVRRDPFAVGYSTLNPDEYDAMAKDALARIGKIDPELRPAFAAMDDGLAAKTLAQADKYVAAKMPRNALRLIDAASQILGGHAELEERRRKILETSGGVDVLLPRALALRPGAERVWSSPDWTEAGGKLTADKAKSALLVYDAGLGDRYRFEATIRPGAPCGEDPFCGVFVGADADGPWKCVGTDGEIISLFELFATPKDLGQHPSLTEAERKSFRLAVEARPRLLRVLVDGVVMLEQEFPAGALRGGVGLIVHEMSAEFSEAGLFE